MCGGLPWEAPRRNSRYIRRERHRRLATDTTPQCTAVHILDMKTVTTALEAIGVFLCVTEDTDEERVWIQTRAAYLHKALETHPDREGGDENAFRRVNEAFEMLKCMHKTPMGILGNLHSPAQVSFAADGTCSGAAYSPFTWGFFEHASGEGPVVGYKVEVAKTSRGKCTKSGETIPEGELRFGSLVPETGTFSRWVALKNVRVPSVIWTGFKGREADVEAALVDMDGLVLVGFTSLSAEDKKRVVVHFADAKNHAVKSVPKKRVRSKDSVPYTVESMLDRKLTTSTENQPRVQKLALPVPEVHGDNHDVAHEDQLAGKIICITGVFPEIGGGVGISHGKGSTKEWLEAHGAKVTGSISKKTNLLVVGVEPGRRKVDDATRLGVKMVKLEDLVKGLETNAVSDVPPHEIDVGITAFSRGFGAKRLCV